MIFYIIGQAALPMLVNLFDTNVQITCSRQKDQVGVNYVAMYYIYTDLLHCIVVVL